MKLIGLLSAAAIAVTAVPAMAQMTHTETRRTTVEHSTGYRGPAVAVRHHRRRVCTVQRYHHRQVRRCAWR